MRSSKRKIRNSSRPGSQASHEPPALTFGRTGKQKVKLVSAELILVREKNTLRLFGRGRLR
jgi:hypothetical protein